MVLIITATSSGLKAFVQLQQTAPGTNLTVPALPSPSDVLKESAGERLPSFMRDAGRALVEGGDREEPVLNDSVEPLDGRFLSGGLPSSVPIVFAFLESKALKIPGLSFPGVGFLLTFEFSTSSRIRFFSDGGKLSASVGTSSVIRSGGGGGKSEGGGGKSGGGGGKLSSKASDGESKPSPLFMLTNPSLLFIFTRVPYCRRHRTKSGCAFGNLEEAMICNIGALQTLNHTMDSHTTR